MVKEKTGASKIILYICITVMAVFTLVPFVWMLVSSVKLNNHVFTVPIQWIPKEWHLENYVNIWIKIPLATYFKNSMILAVSITVIQLVTSSFAAYGFAKIQFKGRDVLFLAYIGTIAVPWQVYMVPQFIMIRNMGLNDTLLSLVLLQAFNAFGVFMMRQYYESIPDELCEAARIDGLNEWGIYLRVILPLSKPAIASLTIITFVNTWNDYMGPFIYLSSDANKTLQVGLRSFISQYDADYASIMAASVVSILPVAIVFLLMQKQFVQGIATSGLKG